MFFFLKRNGQKSVDEKIGVSTDWTGEMRVKTEVETIMNQVFFIVQTYSDVFGLLEVGEELAVNNV